MNEYNLQLKFNLLSLKENLGTYEIFPPNIFHAVIFGSYKLEVNNIRPPSLLRCKVNNAFELFLSFCLICASTKEAHRNLLNSFR